MEDCFQAVCRALLARLTSDSAFAPSFNAFVMAADDFFRDFTAAAAIAAVAFSSAEICEAVGVAVELILCVASPSNMTDFLWLRPCKRGSPETIISIPSSTELRLRPAYSTPSHPVCGKIGPFTATSLKFQRHFVRHFTSYHLLASTTKYQCCSTELQPLV